MSQTALYHSTSTWNMISVAKTLIQKATGYTWMSLPMIRVPDVALSQIVKTTFRQTSFFNDLAEDGTLYWKHGDGHPGYLEGDDYEVTLTYRGRTTKAIARAKVEAGAMSLAAFNAYRHADLQGNIIPKLNSRSMQRIERDFHRRLRSTAYWGAALTFSNGPLDVPAANQKPYMEFETHLNTNVRPILQLGDYEIHVYWSPAVRTSFGNHPDYTGRGGADINLARGLNPDEITNRFASAHGIDPNNIHCADSVVGRDGSANIVQDGETPTTLEFLTEKLFAVQLLPKQKVFDLVDRPEVDKPDGALGVCMGGNLLPDTIDNQAGKTEDFRVTWGHGIQRLRTDVTMGWHWDGDTIVT